MLARWSDFVYRRAWLVLLAGIAFMAAGGIYGGGLFASLKGGGFDDPRSESSRAAEALHEQLGQAPGALIVLFRAPDGLTVDDPAYRAAVEQSLGRLQGRPEVLDVTTFYASGAPQLVSADRAATYAVVGLAGDEAAHKAAVTALRPLLTSERLQVRLGGAPVANQDVDAQVEHDLVAAERRTFPILLVLLVVVFGSLLAAPLPLVVGAMSILGAFLVLRLTTQITDVSVFAINVVTMLGLGLAIDYALFVISRFREELARDERDVAGALRRTMQTAGRTVFFSGLTVTLCLLCLLVFPQMFLRSMGLGGAAAVGVAMLAALTLLPAILALLGRRVNALSIRRRRSAGADGAAGERGFWGRLSAFVMRRPVVVLVATLVPLLLAGTPFLRVQFANPDARSLPPGRESRVVAEELQRDFPRNETEPVQLVVRAGGGALDGANLAALHDYTRRIAAVPGVRRVDSLVTLDPRLDAAAYGQLYAPANLARDPRAAAVADRFAEGEHTLVNVLYDSDPVAAETQRLVREIRAVAPPAGFAVLVGGRTAGLVDFLDSLRATVPRAFALLIVTILVLLFLMLGSLVAPLKAVLLNILSLSASFGALVWIFQDGNLSGLLRFTPLGTIDASQPVLIFAIAFGLALDYEVFLLSRIKEQYDRSGDVPTAVAQGVQKTGGLITSAALLLFVVVAGFATGEIILIKQIGVGLGLAIILDATIVRMLLVPASMRLLGKWNWWAPAPLTALYHRLGLGEVAEAPEPAPAGRAAYAEGD